MSHWSDRITFILVAGAVLLMVSLPFVVAAGSAGDAYVFTGFLLNPLDGNSYLAKMYQGWRGDWLFTLPFTAQPGAGSFLYWFYLLLGRFARVVHLPLLLVFHLARMAGVLCLLWALFGFFRSLDGRPYRYRAAFFLAALGSGMGWALLPWGAFTSDFWIAETYPFLSALVNPHFAFGLAAVLWLLTGLHEQRLAGVGKKAVIALVAFMLGWVSPFGLAITVVVAGGDLLWRAWSDRWGSQLDFYYLRRSVLHSLIPWLVLGGIGPLSYQLWITRVHPVLRGWNAQNLTPSPPLWDTVISLSPALLLALLGAALAFRRKMAGMQILAIWLAAGLIAMYLPWGLQRRFMMGLFIPVVGLAVYGLDHLARGDQARFRRLFTILVLLSLPTNLFLMMGFWHFSQIHEDWYYLTRGEAQGMEWLQAHSDPDALILTGPDTGMFIPAQTGRRVIYGHPFETVQAEEAARAVVAFFEGRYDLLLAEQDIDYVFFGPRERSLGFPQVLDDWTPAFSTEDVQIYAVSP